MIHVDGVGAGRHRRASLRRANRGIRFEPLHVGPVNRCLAWMLGPGSVVHVEVRAGRPGESSGGCEWTEVDQLLDLSAASDADRVCLRLTGDFVPWQSSDRAERRLTLIRYASMRMNAGVKLGDLFYLDCSGLRECSQDASAPHAWMLLNARGHGTSGSIQLVSRSLGERLLESFPSIYHA